MKALNSPVLWLVVVVVATVAIMFVFKFRSRHDWGFKDVVKNPKLWIEMAEAHEEVERAAEKAKQWKEGQVAAAVNRFVFDIANSQEAAREARILESLKSRTHPTVLHILGDASHHARLVIQTGKTLLPEGPFNRACDLLGDTPPTEAASLIAPFLDEPSNEIRKEAALVLGKIGTPEVVAPLRKAFADSDEYVRSYGLMGLQKAIENHRLDERCARELYKDIEQLAIAGKNSDESASLLLHIDQPRATELFLSEKIFIPGAESLHEALKALANKRVTVPRDRLLRLIAELEKAELKYPVTYALRESLRLLGQQRLTEDRSFLQKRLSSPDSEVAEGAAAGLLASFDLEGFDQRIWDTEQEHGFSALTAPQKHYRAVLMYDHEVNNGGLSQYFLNSSGDHWRDALAGLEAMGSSERLLILRNAIAKFGKDAPSEDRDRRQEQLAKLARKNDTLFDTLDERYYNSKEAIDVIAKLYVLKTADAFK